MWFHVLSCVQCAKKIAPKMPGFHILWFGENVLISLSLLIKNKYCCALIWTVS